MRQIVLDTETTGLGPELGHRIIEIAAVELIDGKETGRCFHRYLNPGRIIDANALAVHGITTMMLEDKETFSDVAGELVEFIRGSELLIHNASFDVRFINYELSLLGAQAPAHSVEELCTVIDTFQLARRLKPGQKNDLESLCAHYGIETWISETRRALRDAKLLAPVYQAMRSEDGR